MKLHIFTLPSILVFIMKTHLTETPLKGLLVIDIDYFKDERGFFMEPWNERDFKEAGLELSFKQEGHSGSGRGVLRGLHYQDMTAPLGKLVRCLVGNVFDVCVDLRTSSPTFGKWYGIELSAENKKLLYIPIGFAHGFMVTSNYAEVHYKMTEYYTPSAEGAIIWNDRDLKIDWPGDNPILSEKDKKAPTLKEYLEHPAFI